MSDLAKGANIPLTKENPNLTKITVGITWTTTDAVLQSNLNFGAVLCNQSGKALTSTDVVFFNQLADSSNTVTMGDDVQQVDIDLSKVPDEVERIDFILWSNAEKNRSLSQVRNIRARVIDTMKDTKLVQTEDFSSSVNEAKALLLVQLYRYKGDWKLRSLGDGWKDGLAGVTKAYGIT